MVFYWRRFRRYFLPFNKMQEISHGLPVSPLHLEWETRPVNCWNVPVDCMSSGKVEIFNHLEVSAECFISLSIFIGFLAQKIQCDHHRWGSWKECVHRHPYRTVVSYRPIKKQSKRPPCFEFCIFSLLLLVNLWPVFTIFMSERYADEAAGYVSYTASGGLHRKHKAVSYTSAHH